MKEKIKLNTPLNTDDVRHIESQHYSSRSFKSAIESGLNNTYEWFEDQVIQKKASAEIGTDETGSESATIKMLSPTSNKEEVVYYTTNFTEVMRIQALLEGKRLIIDKTE